MLEALRSRELEIKFEKKSNPEGFQARGRTEKRNNSKGKGKSRSKSIGKKVCWYYQKEGHIIRFCPARKKESDHTSQNQTTNLSDGFHNAKVFNVSLMEENKEWVMDS